MGGQFRGPNQASKPREENIIDDQVLTLRCAKSRATSSLDSVLQKNIRNTSRSLSGVQDLSRAVSSVGGPEPQWSGLVPGLYDLPRELQGHLSLFETLGGAVELLEFPFLHQMSQVSQAKPVAHVCEAPGRSVSSANWLVGYFDG